METDRQTDRQTDGHTDRPTESEIERERERGRKREMETVSVQFQFQLKMASEKPIRAPPLLSAVSPRLPSKQCQCLSGRTQIVPDLERWNVGRFLSPLLFPSGDQCCDALACPCSENSSSLGAPLPCQAADQMRYLMSLLVYLPLHSH